MSEVLDPTLLTKLPQIRAYQEKRRKLTSSKTVSKEQAMAQILRYSRVKSANVYDSTQLTEDGKLILKPSRST